MCWRKEAHNEVDNEVDMDIEEIFSNFFMDYCERADKREVLRYVITSTLREGSSKNPHAMPGNAMDITLRLRGDYASITAYNELFIEIMAFWPFRAGIDNTRGNIHIHLDLGQVKPARQSLPYFFKEDGGKWQAELKTIDDLYKIR